MGAASSAQAWVAPPEPVPAAPTDGRFGAPAAAASTWSVAASGAWIGGPGGLPSGFAPAISISWQVSPAWAAQLVALAPALGTVDSPVGSAKVDQELAVSRVRYDIAQGRFAPYFAAGLGVYHLGASGTAPAPYIASSGHAWAAVAMAGAGVRVSLGRPFALVAELDAVVAAPRPVVDFAGQEGLYAGRPTAVGSLGGEVSW